MDDTSTGEKSVHPVEESLTTIPTKRSSPLKISANGQLPTKYHDRYMETIIQDNYSGSSSNSNSNCNSVSHFNSTKTGSPGLGFIPELCTKFTSNEPICSKAHSLSTQSPDIIISLNSSSSMEYISRPNRPRSFYDNVC